MPGYSFTDDVQRALQAAREEAATRRHAEVAPEHLFLGLVRQHAAPWGAVFKQLAVDPGALSRQVAAVITSPVMSGAVGPDFPYTPASMRVLELATIDAGDLGYAWIGAEHLLLAIVREGTSPAAQVLAHNGVTLGRLRAALARWTPPSAG